VLKRKQCLFRRTLLRLQQHTQNAPQPSILSVVVHTVALASGRSNTEDPYLLPPDDTELPPLGTKLYMRELVPGHGGQFGGDLCAGEATEPQEATRLHRFVGCTSACSLLISVNRMSSCIYPSTGFYHQMKVSL
jgi:hypothetical protein